MEDQQHVDFDLFDISALYNKVVT